MDFKSAFDFSSLSKKLSDVSSSISQASQSIVQVSSSALDRAAEVLDRTLIGNSTSTSYALESALSKRLPSATQPQIREEELLQLIQQVLSCPTVDLKLLRSLAKSGLPDAPPTLRATAWRLLGGLLPPEQRRRAPEIAKRRDEYYRLVEEFLPDARGGPRGSGPAPHAPSPLSPPAALNRSRPPSPAARLVAEGADPLSATRSGPPDPRAPAPGLPPPRPLPTTEARDHPLSDRRESEWTQHFKDRDVLAQIDKDVVRTRPGCHFFASNDPDGGALHRHEIRRALFIFARLNGRIAYVQGMNELIAPLYFVLRSGSTGPDRDCAEADSFYLLTDLMGEVRDCYCRELDETTGGIRALLQRLGNMVGTADPELALHLYARLQIDPQLYALRWLMTCLATDFELPEVLHIFDSFWAAESGGRMEAVLRFCVAIHLHPRVRTPLLQADFASAIKLLQNVSALEVPVPELLRLAASLPPL